MADAAVAAGEILARLDDDGLAFESPSLTRRWRFADAREYEDAGGMIYLWPKNSAPPAFFPTRAFADEAEFGELARLRPGAHCCFYARGRGGRRLIGERIGAGALQLALIARRKKLDPRKTRPPVETVSIHWPPERASPAGS